MTQRLNAFFERAEARWSRLSLRRRAWIAAALLTAAVALLTGALFGMFALRGSSILFRDDDFAQHYPFLIAIGRWWRAFFADPLHAPLFDFSLGFGEDFIGGLNYYGLGDPLTVLAALFAPERTYVCYRMLAALRIELAGLAFLAFCREHRVRWRGALPAAAAYAFTVYMVAWCALKHPMFANPCIHLPLMLLGAERRLKGKSPAALIFATAWSALCGFYFLYMNSLMLLLYALARHFALNGRDALRRLPGAFGRTLAAYLLGVGMAGAFLLPAALSFLESCRNGMAAGESLLWYSPSTYWAFPISFIASNGWSNAMTVPAAAMLAVLALFAGGRENRGLKLAVAATMLALLIPAVGVVFNGFSYPTDRWKYGGLLLLCYVFARFSGSVEKGGRGRLACGLLLIWCVVLAIRWKRFGEAVPHPLLIALAAALCVLTFIEILLAQRLHRGLESAPALKRALSAGLLVLFVGVNILADMLPIGVSLLLDNGATKDPWTRMQECSLAVVGGEDGENAAATSSILPGRVDLTVEETIGYNAPSVFGVASTAMYDSIRPAATSAFMRALALNTDVTANRTLGLDNRAALEAVWAVRAQTRPAQALSPVPYGFETEKETPSAALLRNECALPMAYAMDKALSRAEYDAMPPLEKQWALLSRAVLEPGETSLPEAGVERTSASVPWRVAETDNAALTLSADGGTLAFGPGGGSVALELDGMADSETYLWLQNLRWTGAERDDSTRITVRSEAGASLLTYAHDGYRYALGQRDYLNNVGYSAAPCARIELSCAREGSFAFDSMETLCQPMADFEALVEARREGVNCVFDGPNRLAARSEADRPRVIMFAVPALKGWRAEVDGQPARLLAQAGGLCAVEVPAGAHTAAIAYRTPGLTVGLALSGGCLAVSILWLLGRKRRG